MNELYLTCNLNDSIETQLTANGYITPDGEYRFYLRDYQGNDRLTYTAAGIVLERNVYFPFLKIIV